MACGTKHDPVSRTTSHTSVPWLPRAAIALAAAVALALSGSSEAFAEPSPPTGTQIRHAIVEPSVVFIVTHYVGYFRDATYGVDDFAHELALIVGSPVVQGAGTCTGFVVNPDGYIGTAGHCVDPAVGKRKLIDRALALLEQAHDLPSGRLNEVKRYAYTHWDVTGAEKNSPVVSKVDVTPPPAARDRTSVTAKVESFQPIGDGDVALLKMPTPTTGPLPALQVAPGAAPSSGTPVTAVGFPGAVAGLHGPDDQVPTHKTPSKIDGTVSGREPIRGSEYTEIGPKITPGMSGGPTVDAQGQVLGINSFNAVAEHGGDHGFITDTANTRNMLGKHNTLSPADRAYREGLADYSAGRYRDAVEKLDQVIKENPRLVQAEEFRKLASQRAAEQPSGPSTLVWILIGIGVLVVLAGGATAALLLRRRRGRGAIQGTAAGGAGNGS